MKEFNDGTVTENNTGEVEEFQVIDKEMRDFNFHKVWLQNILATLEIIGSQKMKIALHIVDNLNSDNVFIGTNRDIAEKLKCSTVTVNTTLKILIENDFLRKIQTGVYMVNPNMIFKGSRQGRMNVLIRYTDSTKTKKSAECKELEKKLK